MVEEEPEAASISEEDKQFLQDLRTYFDLSLTTVIETTQAITDGVKELYKLNNELQDTTRLLNERYKEVLVAVNRVRDNLNCVEERVFSLENQVN